MDPIGGGGQEFPALRCTVSASNVQVFPTLCACELCEQLPAEAYIEGLGLWICQRCMTELELAAPASVRTPAPTTPDPDPDRGTSLLATLEALLRTEGAK